MSRRRVYKTKRNTQLIGIIITLLSIIGIGTLGIVGKFIMGIGVFLFGELWIMGLIVVGLSGIYMTFANKSYGITIRSIGLSMIIFAVLILFHLNYVTELTIEPSGTFKMVFDQTISSLIIIF